MTKRKVTWRPGIVVFDAWWPQRLGLVEKQNKSSVYVRWFDGEMWRYDRDHKQFLRHFNRRRV